MKVAICTLAINEWYQEIVKYGVKTLELYAKRHGYDFYNDTSVYDAALPASQAPRALPAVRPLPWYKIKAIQKILPQYDYVFWIDADGFIMKPEQSIKYFIDIFLREKDKDILIGRDWNNPLNTGVMVIKNTPFTNTLLEAVWNNKNEFDANFHEQASLGEIYEKNRFNSQNHIEVLPLNSQNVFYSYWSAYYPDRQFFMHIARCVHDRTGFMYTMDLYCPIKMEEETEEDYQERLKWLNSEEICRKDIDEAMKGGPRNRKSRRTLEYEKRK